VDEIGGRVAGFGGKSCRPVDRPAFSMTSQLGFVVQGPWARGMRTSPPAVATLGYPLTTSRMPTTPSTSPGALRTGRRDGRTGFPWNPRRGRYQGARRRPVPPPPPDFRAHRPTATRSVVQALLDRLRQVLLGRLRRRESTSISLMEGSIRGARQALQGRRKQLGQAATPKASTLTAMSKAEEFPIASRSIALRNAADLSLRSTKRSRRSLRRCHARA
jgi:hypothetical protein